MGSIYLPYQKPPRWNIDPNGITYNCARMGLFGPGEGLELSMPMWGAGNKVYDYSGNRNNMPITGATWQGNNLDFDGTGDYLGPTNIATSLDEFSIFMKIFPHTWTLNNTGFAGVQGWITGSWYLRQYKADNKLQFNVKGNTPYSVGGPNVDFGATYLNKWTNIVLTYSKTAKTAKIYLNGHLEGEHTWTTVAQSALFDDFVVGTEYDLTRCFDGLVADVILFTKVLNPTQAATISNDPYGMFEPIRSPAIWSVPPVGGVAPTSIFYGPLGGSLSGPI